MQSEITREEHHRLEAEKLELEAASRVIQKAWRVFQTLPPPSGNRSKLARADDFNRLDRLKKDVYDKLRDKALLIRLLQSEE